MFYVIIQLKIVNDFFKPLLLLAMNFLVNAEICLKKYWNHLSNKQSDFSCLKITY